MHAKNICFNLLLVVLRLYIGVKFKKRCYLCNSLPSSQVALRGIEGVRN